MITAEIIVVGSELLLGGRADTNSIFLAEMLAEQGIEARFKTVVGDDIEDICGVLAQASKRAKVVLVTGGLGPTVDDVTREAMSKLTETSLRLRPRALRSIQARFKVVGRTVTANQRRQAYLPSGADLLRNTTGTAPGFSLKWRKCRIFCLPGVSHEARAMFLDSVLPILVKEHLFGQGIESRSLQTFGLIEGVVDERIQGVVPEASGVQVGILASPLGVSVSLTRLPNANRFNAKIGNENRENFNVPLEEYLMNLSTKLQPFVFGLDGQPMEEIIGQALSKRGLTLAMAESCTGGLIGHRLTQVPGSSSYMDRGVVCYSNQAKMDLLGVTKNILQKHGAVSAPVAKAMAEGIRSRSGVDLGLSVTGIAGPGGGTPIKPVGLVYVALSIQGKTFTKEFRFQGDRNMVKLRASQGALDVLRRWLFGISIADDD
ncbi:competence/damage-inducible protein A [Candidatus Nitronereus thalassa]|uniref:CinA-like protein n=1 Tax=Candidatus Nitronereus thalassa TaxID=3020898 RepID=A0ABU3K3X6_9BACT|nr:competence/damage-inducible protein A [Candidatus Nitronereus thalassa]MDT7041081.1 competence/damage-inducible protein A [Candidatus Nitronereus thalassa]